MASAPGSCRLCLRRSVALSRATSQCAANEHALCRFHPRVTLTAALPRLCRRSAERPWRVMRSATGNLPVYTDIRVGGTRRVTILRKYAGDVEALKAELEQVTGREVVQFHGRLEVKGTDQRKVVADWLRSLGF